MIPKINWHPSRQEITQFGRVILVGFGLIGLLFFLRHKATVAGVMWGVAAFVWLLSITLPQLAKGFYWIWMGFGFVMGSIMSVVVMTVIFFGILTPVAILFKLLKRDALRRRPQSGESYWIDHPKISDKSYYDHLT
jgi:hypothetical protein